MTVRGEYLTISSSEAVAASDIQKKGIRVVCVQDETCSPNKISQGPPKSSREPFNQSTARELLTVDKHPDHFR
jgi:hypothetical protein